MIMSKRLCAALVTAALAIPTTGATAARGAPDTPRAFPEGVYRGKITRADILRVWPNADDQAFRSLAGTVTHTFRGGSWSQVISSGGTPGCRRVEGRYSVQGRFLILTVVDLHGCPTPVRCPCVHRFRWSYGGEALHFRLISAALPFVHVLWDAVPFERIR